jgi:hypothetical protein
MNVANILSNTELKVPKDFNVVDSASKIIDGLPTLIIGFDYVNQNYPDFDITNIKIHDNLFWTFKKNEKRDKHEEDLYWFISYSYANMIKNVSYVFVDPIQYSSKNMRKIIRKILSTKNIVSFIDKQMIYLSCDEIIFGVDLNLIRYIGLDENKIKSKIISASSVFLENKEILIEYNIIVEYLENNIRFLPHLYSVRNGQNNINSVIHIP